MVSFRIPVVYLLLVWRRDRRCGCPSLMKVVWRVVASHVLWESVQSSTLVTHTDIFFLDSIYDMDSAVRGGRGIIEGCIGPLNGKARQDI